MLFLFFFFLLEIVATRDDFGLRIGARVSLGNSHDLTQDAGLPSGFFFFIFIHLVPCAFFALLPSCPLSCPLWRGVMDSCGEQNEDLRYCSHIQYLTPGLIQL